MDVQFSSIQGIDVIAIQTDHDSIMPDSPRGRTSEEGLLPQTTCLSAHHFPARILFCPFGLGTKMSCQTRPHSRTIWIGYSRRPRFASALLVPKENFAPAAFASLIKDALGIL